MAAYSAGRMMEVKMNRYFGLFILSLIVFLFIFSGSCSRNRVLSSNNESKKVVFILKSENGDYWNSMKMGADTAAKEFNVDMEYMIPSDEEDTDGQIKLVSKAIDEKADAIILEPSDYRALVDIVNKAHSQKIPVIIVDSELNTDNIDCFIGTDNVEAGRKAGSEILKIAGPNAKVAIMGFVSGNPIGDKREEGLLDSIKKYPGIEVVAKKYCSADSMLAATLTKNMLNDRDDIDVIVALDGKSSEGVAQSVSDINMTGKVKVISFDSNPKEIEYLEDGIIQATVIQNPFSMGYLGVKYADYSAEGKDVKKIYDTGSKLIDRDNMYSTENQKLLFPFVR